MLHAAGLAADSQLPQGLTPGDWLRAGLTLTVAVLVAAMVSRGLRELLGRRQSHRLAAHLVARLTGYLVVAAGFLYTLIALHIDVGPLVGALGIGGLALALATQDLLTNALGSVLLEVGRALHRGDNVRLGEYEGIVEDIDLRTVVLRTFDGQRVFVPNSCVMRAPIANRTALGRRRVVLRVGVGYGTDLRAARDVVRAAVAAVPEVVDDPPPQVLVEEFGDSSITLALRFWHGPIDPWVVRDAVAVAVKEAVDGAGIEIPFPQRTLRFAEPPGGDGDRDGLDLRGLAAGRAPATPAPSGAGGAAPARRSRTR